MLKENNALFFIVLGKVFFQKSSCFYCIHGAYNQMDHNYILNKTCFLCRLWTRFNCMCSNITIASHFDALEWVMWIRARELLAPFSIVLVTKEKMSFIYNPNIKFEALPMKCYFDWKRPCLPKKIHTLRQWSTVNLGIILVGTHDTRLFSCNFFSTVF